MTQFEEAKQRSDESFASGCGIEMPRYRCHKEVWALKIKEIHPGPNPTIAELKYILNGRTIDVGAVIVPEEEGYAPFSVTREFFLKRDPKVGGYYVVYKDGYKSFSPAEVFEDGYARI